MHVSVETHLFFIMKIHLQPLLVFTSLLCSQALQAGQYDSLPLQDPVAPEPHFQTELGRNGHRFADALINKYRLYDFYERQARYHLTQTNKLELLLPYPGLEGGRRGHWGGTNEKLSAAYPDRKIEPKYHRLLNRGKGGDQYVCVSHDASQSVIAFERGAPTMRTVKLEAKLHTPVHAFSHVVDRFGFGISVAGNDYFTNNGAEWHKSSGQEIPISSEGYHLYGEKVIFERMVGKAKLLDSPSVSYVNKTPVYSRHYQWLGKTPALLYKLPLQTQKLENEKLKIVRTNDAWWAILKGDKFQVIHQVQYSGNLKAVKLHQTDGRIVAEFPTSEKGTKIQFSSWVSPVDAKQQKTPAIALQNLYQWTNGGERYFTKDVVVKGELNADPAASGTAYELDEIPVPVENPYGVPMTLCGLAFDKDGAAYISTLVGDIWKVSGLDDDLSAVRWQRFASGINNPLGLEMVDGVVFAISKTQVLQIIDKNGDGEADFVKPFTKLRLPSDHAHDLQRDAKGNFYFSNVNGTHRLSADGKKLEKVSEGSRNPMGSGVRADGLALSDASEGNKGNGTCTVFESAHPENAKTVAKLRRILYLPRGVDNSPGSRLFINDDRFGPLGKSIIGVSYGSGRFYQIMRDPNNGSPQAALQVLPGEFASGASRLGINPKDGQLYVTGFDAWGDFAVAEGSFSRVRFTGEKSLTPVSWKAYSNGVSISFSDAIDPASIDAKKFFVQQWNYRDSAHTYGSAEYSVKSPEKIGHDNLVVESVYLSKDGKELFVNVPSLRPAMCTQIFSDLVSTSGVSQKLNLFATINQISNKSLKGVTSDSGKPSDLVPPYHEKNGNTYAVLNDFFDKRAGKNPFVRPVGPVVEYQKDKLNYKWVNDNIIMMQGCIGCHNANSKQDFSSYEGLLKVVEPGNPGKSHILGMVNTGSMPPFPMPTLDPKMQKALEEWIKMGAPKE